ncbi:MAG: hypothetical protein SYR96_38915 [Actinomycetota bacterium]|nr:hypothetical protein [Actinomycetota bacterium]
MSTVSHAPVVGVAPPQAHNRLPQLAEALIRVVPVAVLLILNRPSQRSSEE